MDSRSIEKRALAYLFDLKRRRSLIKKTRKIIAEASLSSPWKEVPERVSDDYRKLWKGMSEKASLLYLKMYGNISGIWDPGFIPETIYYNRVEPCLNNKAFSKAYTDKNIYPLLLREFNVPETLIRNLNGIYYSNENKPVGGASIIDFLNGNDRIIIKPAVDSGGGKGVSLWNREKDKFISANGEILSPWYIERVYTKNFIIQKAVEQHPFYSAFNKSSVNTVRLLTYRSVKDESIHILHNILRAGAAGSITDNQASGGYACAVSDSGKLTGIAVDKKGIIHKSVNGKILEAGLKLEGIDEIRETALKVAARFPYSRLLGLDICLDINGNVRLIEVNDVNNEINFYQMLYGPLFRSFTGEIVTWCSQNMRSFLIDFDL